MSSPFQKRALQTCRDRLGGRGLARFEVLAPERDRELIRALAKRLAKNDAAAAQLRADVSRQVSGEPAERGRILAALRRSPLVGADLSLRRQETVGRAIDL